MLEWRRAPRGAPPVMVRPRLRKRPASEPFIAARRVEAPVPVGREDVRSRVLQGRPDTEAWCSDVPRRSRRLDKVGPE